MIAFIPARGGSKGLPGKNIKELCGKPLITHTIEAALHARYIHRVVVTTDSKEIADAAAKAGAEVPFLRPAYLASDTASAIDVYIHAADYMRENYKEDVSKFMVLLPTAPLRNANHIDEAYKLFVEKQSETLVSVTEAKIPPSWYLYLDKNGNIHNADFGKKNGLVQNRQNNGTFYIPNGAIYILDYRLLNNNRTYYSERTVAYIMQSRESMDIDTDDDFNYVQYLMEQRNKT